MPEPTPPNTCPNEECDGSGYIDNEPCPVCFGAGALPIKGGPARILKELADHVGQLNDILDKCNDIKEKVDEIKDVVDEL